MIALLMLDYLVWLKNFSIFKRVLFQFAIETASMCARAGPPFGFAQGAVVP